MNKDDLKKRFQMPVSEVRWTGFSLAHHTSRDGVANAKKSKRNKNDDEVTGSFTLFLVFSVATALLLVLTMAVCFIYTW